MQAANDLLEEWRANKAPSKQNWGQRISNLNESWTGVRQSLFNAVLSSCGVDPGRNICMKCLKNPAFIRCHGCHMHMQLCGACDQSVHEILPFHDRSAYNSGFYKPIPPTVSVDHDGKWVSVGLCFCFFPQKENVIVLDSNVNLQLFKFERDNPQQHQKQDRNI